MTRKELIRQAADELGVEVLFRTPYSSSAEDMVVNIRDAAGHKCTRMFPAGECARLDTAWNRWPLELVAELFRSYVEAQREWMELNPYDKEKG